MTQAQSKVTSQCTSLSHDTPQKLIFVQQIPWPEMMVRWLVLIFYGFIYVLLLPINGFFLWKFLSLYGEIKVNCTIPAPGLVTCDISQSQFGGLVVQRQALTNPEVLEPFDSQSTGCYYSLVNLIHLLNLPLPSQGCYASLIIIDVNKLQLQAREKPLIAIEQWSKITFIDQYPFIPETRIDFGQVYQISQPNPLPFAAQLDYRREPGLLMAIAVAASIWGAMTSILHHLIVTLLRPKQQLTLDKNGDRWHFQAFIPPRQDDSYPLKAVSSVIFEQVINDQQATTYTVAIPLQNAKTYQFLFGSQQQEAETFARTIAQFLPVDLIRR